MARVRVLGSTRQPGRCAYCHDDLGAVGHCCSSCQTWVHLDCWREAGTCPSPGCDERPPSPAERPRPRHASPRRRRGGREHVQSDRDLVAWAEERAQNPRAYAGLARTMPFVRLLFSLALTLGVVLGASAVGLVMISGAAQLGVAERANDVLVGLAIGVASFGVAAFGVAWLLRWPAVWKETRRLLTTALPTPMRMRVWTERRGKNRTTYLELREARPGRSSRPRASMEKIQVSGLLPAFWVAERCSRKPVLVYGAEDGQPPFLLEDADGRLALIDP